MVLANRITAGVEPVLPEDALLESAAGQAISKSTFLCCIATDETGAIRILNAGAVRMLGYAPAEVRGMRLTALCAQQELVARAALVSKESGEAVPPGFEALVRNASRGNEEDVFALTYLRKDGSRLPAMVSVSALRGERGAVIGYLLMGTDDSERRRAEDALRGRTATLAKADLQKPVVLVIDDDDRALEVLRLFLEVEGFAVVQAIGAKEALLEASRHTLALITLDLQMHGMDGWQLLERLRKDSKLAGVPVIIASGDPGDEGMAKSCGAAAVLQKPIGRAALKATLAKLDLLKFRGGFSG